MKRLAILFGVLVGCSSANETFPIQEEASIPDHHFDASTPDASIKDVITDEACALAAWSLPCEATIYDAPPTWFNQDANLPKSYVSSSISFGGSTNIGYVDGLNISSSQVGDIVGAVINSNALPYDPNGIYFVLTSADVDQDGTWLCNFYCAWHDSEYVLNNTTGSYLVRYGLLADVANKCPTECAPYANGSRPSPNNNWSADAIINLMAHEVSEAATDPDPGITVSWRDMSEAEVADKCAWDFGDVFSTSNNAPYNIQVGSNFFLAQKLWARETPVGLDAGIDNCTLNPNGGFGFDAGSVPTSTTALAPNETSPIEYYGGAVISQPIHIYFIWYGSWTQQSVIQPILTDFINGLGTSDWWKSATEYFDEPSLNLIPDGGSFVSLDGGNE